MADTPEEGGYDDDLFVDEPPEYLKCILCSLVLRDPIQVLACGHKFCRTCFDRVKRHFQELRCPLDRELVNPNGVCDDKGIKRIIGDLKVKCSGDVKGCPWRGDLSSLNEHLSKCKYLSGDPFASLQGNHTDESVRTLLKDMNDRIGFCENSLHNKDVEINGLKTLLHQLRSGYDAKVSEVDSLRSEVKSLREKTETLETLLSQLLDERQQPGEQHSQPPKTQRLLPRPPTQGLVAPSAPYPEEDDQRGRSPSSLELFRLDFQYNLAASSSTAEAANDQSQEPILAPHNGSNPSNVSISDDNHIDFIGNSTVSLPQAVLRPGIKAWYEVTFIEGSVGSFVGWAMKNYFTIVEGATNEEDSAEPRETALGDCRFSYAFDAWEGKTLHCGIAKSWGKVFTGSRYQVLGVAADMVEGTLLYSINGKWTEPMGIAFRGIDKYAQLFPAISERGNKKDTLHVNFGQSRFSYAPPDPSFKKLIDVI